MVFRVLYIANAARIRQNVEISKKQWEELIEFGQHSC
jgi:hypothetical protein